MHRPVLHNAFMKEAHHRLQEARELAGYKTPTDAARALRIAQPTYLAHENGSRGFKAQAARYANFYRVDLRWLLTGVGAPRGNPIEITLSQLSEEKRRQAIEYIEFLAKSQK